MLEKYTGAKAKGRESDLCISITFEKGKYRGMSYQGYIWSCTSPLCHCRDIDIELESINEKYSFRLDVFGQELVEDPKSKLSGSVKKFARSFLEELTEEDWEWLRSIFISHKRQFLENCNIDELDAVFPYDEIEQERDMVGYAEIFPYCEQYLFEKDGVQFIIDDQYCLNSKCNCRNTILTLLPADPEPPSEPDFPAIKYDYKKRKWETVEKGHIEGSLADLVEEMMHAFPGLPKIVKERHRQLRTMYRNYRMRHGLHTKDRDERTPARNAPCPCGSGKKYKRCCGKE